MKCSKEEMILFNKLREIRLLLVEKTDRQLLNMIRKSNDYEANHDKDMVELCSYIAAIRYEWIG